MSTGNPFVEVRSYAPAVLGAAATAAIVLILGLLLFEIRPPHFLQELQRPLRPLALLACTDHCVVADRVVHVLA